MSITSCIGWAAARTACFRAVRLSGLNINREVTLDAIAPFNLQLRMKVPSIGRELDLNPVVDLADTEGVRVASRAALKD